MQAAAALELGKFESFFMRPPCSKASLSQTEVVENPGFFNTATQLAGAAQRTIVINI
jgi:hypothetical protein